MLKNIRMNKLFPFGTIFEILLILQNKRTS